MNTSKKSSAKEKILQTVVSILLDKTNIEDITVRSIADKAKVNSALINYYFNSKDELINQAVEVCMGSITEKMYKDVNLQNNPIERLRKMIIDIADFSFHTTYLSRIAVSNDLNNGSINTGQILQPVLKEIYPKKTDIELIIIAMQIIIPIQVLFLNTEEYNKYLHLQLEDKTARDKILHQIINNILYISV